MPESGREETARNAADNVPEPSTESKIELMNEGVVNAGAELNAMQASFEVLSPLEADVRGRAVRWLLDALGMNDQKFMPTSLDAAPSTFAGASPGTGSANTSEEALTPRAFMSQKKPKSLVERMACLAYYLDHFRSTPHFKTGDLVQLNTEAAAPKFSNPSRDADNADRQNGYLVTAGKGLKQITPRGEAVVEALPDRDAVSSALRENPYKVRRSRESSKRSSDRQKDDE